MNRKMVTNGLQPMMAGRILAVDSTTSGAEIPLSKKISVFSHIFGGGGQQGKDHRGGFGQTPGRTIEAAVEVDLGELIHGAAKTISWSSMEQNGRSPGPKE